MIREQYAAKKCTCTIRSISDVPGHVPVVTLAQDTYPDDLDRAWTRIVYIFVHFILCEITVEYIRSPWIVHAQK